MTAERDSRFAECDPRCPICSGEGYEALRAAARGASFVCLGCGQDPTELRERQVVGV